MRLTSVLRAHDHHSSLPKIPDYRCYKVEDVPQLVQVQKCLAAMGLKDPWLRNEVWRYNKEAFGTTKSRSIGLIKRGFGLGFSAFVVTIIVEEIWKFSHPDNSHGHGHGHGHDAHKK